MVVEIDMEGRRDVPVARHDYMCMRALCGLSQEERDSG